MMMMMNDLVTWKVPEETMGRLRFIAQTSLLQENRRDGFPTVATSGQCHFTRVPCGRPVPLSGRTVVLWDGSSSGRTQPVRKIQEARPSFVLTRQRRGGAAAESWYAPCIITYGVLSAPLSRRRNHALHCLLISYLPQQLTPSELLRKLLPAETDHKTLFQGIRSWISRMLF